MLEKSESKLGLTHDTHLHNVQFAKRFFGKLAMAFFLLHFTAIFAFCFVSKTGRERPIDYWTRAMSYIWFSEKNIDLIGIHRRKH